MSEARSEVVISGPISGDTVVLLHGWPDLPEELYRLQIPALIEAGYRVALITLPLYRKGSKANAGAPFFGYDMVAVAESVKVATEQVMKGRSESQAPTLIAHDWGSIIGWHLVKTYPGLFGKFVSLDVGLGMKKGWKTVAATFAYQIVLIIAMFLFPRFLFGDRVTRFAAKVLKAPASQLAHAGMNYLYLQTWIAGFVRRSKLLSSMTSTAVPTGTPILFLYGTKMPLQFHSSRFRESVSAQPNSKVVGYPGDHWFFARARIAPDVNAEILAFLKLPGSKL